MNEENKNNEIKNDENGNTTEEPKQEEKVEEVKEEKKEEEKVEEEKKEEKVAEEKKEEKLSEPKQEEKKEHVRLVEVKPTVKEKKFPWKTAGIVVGAILLSLSSGALGGYVGGKVISNQIKSEIEDVFQSNDDTFGFNDKGGSVGGFGGFEMPEEDTDTPALGITVQKTDESNLVIAGFADDSNGEKNGLEVGDIITKVDGKEVSDTSDIATILDDFKIGDDIKVTVTRDGKEVEATITLIQKTNTYSFQMTPNNNGNNNFPEDDNEKVQG